MIAWTSSVTYPGGGDGGDPWQIGLSDDYNNIHVDGEGWVAWRRWPRKSRRFLFPGTRIGKQRPTRLLIYDAKEKTTPSSLPACTRHVVHRMARRRPEGGRTAAAAAAKLNT